MASIKKSVIVLSGGLDSTTLAYWAKSEGYEIHPISFNYGQIAGKEMQSAEIISNKLNAKLMKIDISSLKKIFKGSTSLVDKEIPIPTQFNDQVIVPFRNAIFLSVAVAYAISINASRVMYGAHKSDSLFYPDCRKEFVESFKETANLGTGKDIAVENPFYNLSKTEIVRIGNSLKIPYELTWSCYTQDEYHCGVCESCNNRKIAFRLSGITDPTKYTK